MKKAYPSVGIDDISVYIPSLYLDIEDLATARGVEPAKLQRGLGLNKMAVPDASEDVITMAAEAVIDLVKKNNLRPEEIARIYVGTESMIDGSKPNASYIMGILTDYFMQRGHSAKSMNNCDVVDMVFACIGAVDAMQNSLDYIRLRPDRKVIVVSTDWAKYELNSPGESTQGAGAFATLISANPRILEIDDEWGVATECVHDFYKPLRKTVSYDEIVQSNGVEAYQLGKSTYSLHKDTPVYDGQYSNQCYTDRIREAFSRFQGVNSFDEHPFDQWEALVFHLPYAFHARRVFVPLFIEYLVDSDQWEVFVEKYNEVWDDLESERQLLKAYSKTEEYKAFVQEKIQSGELASSEVGNLYTGSIFLSLLSTLAADANRDFSNRHLGFFAYGSGSKSKVFQGRVVPGYQEYIQRINLFGRLEQRQRINIHQYEYLHKDKLLINLDSVDRKVFQASSGWQETNRYARNYMVKE